MSFTNVLKEVFGFESLRPFQTKVVTSMLKDENIVVISPTGSGKSLCFQLPALLYEGITIVLSPLKSLIYDQVESLKSKHVSCELLNGDLGVGKKTELFNEWNSQIKKQFYYRIKVEWVIKIINKKSSDC